MQLKQRYKETFKDRYGHDICDRDGHFWRFPYTDVSSALLEEVWPNPYMDRGRLADIVGAGRAEALEEASQSIGIHFRRVLNVAETDGALTDDEGAPVLVRDEQGVRITPIMYALAYEGYGEQEVFDTYEPWLHDESKEPESLDTFEWHLRQEVYTVIEGDESRKVMDYVIAWDKDGTTFTMPFALDEYARRFMYLSLCALVSLLGCRNTVYRILYPMKRELKRTKMKTSQLVIPNDAVTNALFEYGRNAIGPEQYHDGLERSIMIPTGKDSSAELTIVNKQPFDALIETYKLTPKHRFWLETAMSIAYNDGKEPVWEITGADLLKFNGWSNPYQKSAIPTMQDAYKCLDTMAYVLRLAIDTTNEQKRFDGLKSEYELRNVIDGKMRIRKFDDGTEDFALILNRAVGPDPIDAFILARYAVDKKQVVTMTRADMEFKTVKRLQIEHRMMWRYVWRRVCEQKTSNTIVFDTIFKNIGIDGITRQKRSQMLGVLHKMLKERRDQGTLTFEWNKKGNRDYSVTIRKTECSDAICGD
jgi:hypothetical protein